jgi:Cu+-exporting ATPase
MLDRFWVGVVLSVPLLVLVDEKNDFWVARGDLTYFGHTDRSMGCVAVFSSGARSVMTRHLNMVTLIALGPGAAYLYSLVALLFPQLFPSSFREMDKNS